MTPNDVSKCPHCNFPAIGAEMRIVISIINKCPLCEKNLDASNLEKIEDPAQYLKSRKILLPEEVKENTENVTNVITNSDKEKIDL